jgi:hypothetical protein
MSTTTKTTATTSTSTGFWAGVRDDLRERREARLARHHLVRDLEGYRSRSDIIDLLAAVDRHEGPQAELMRDVLQTKLAYAYQGTRLVG